VAVLLDDYTFDEYRGKSLQKYIYRLKLQKLQEMNLEHCRVAYLSDNTYSRKTMLTHGFIETHIWKIIKIAGFSVKRRKEIS
jgi:predicted acetyltransferase